MTTFTALTNQVTARTGIEPRLHALGAWLRRSVGLLVIAGIVIATSAGALASAPVVFDGPLELDGPSLVDGLTTPLSCVLAESTLESPQLVDDLETTPGIRAAAVSTSSRSVATPVVGCTPVQRTTSCLPRQQDQLWVISTRSLGCNTAVSLTGFKAWHYVNGRWTVASVAEFLASDDPAVPTTFYAHGNRIDHQMAFGLGWKVYANLARQAPTAEPLRFVLWSWPSDRIQGGQVEDVRVKAARTNVGGYQMAWFLDQLNPQVRVNLIGYSFGARIVTGSLHLLGGGAIGQYVLTSRQHPDRTPLRAVLQGAALDNDWLLPGRRHGQALSQLDQLLLINNSCDQVLKRYAWLYGQHKNCGPQALGYTGFAGLGSLSAIDRAKIRQIDACCHVGKQHDWALYAGSASLNASMEPYVFFLPIGRK